MAEIKRPHSIDTAKGCTTPEATQYSHGVFAEPAVRRVGGVGIRRTCHACVMLPETNCERHSILLDQALLVGTREDPTCPSSRTSGTPDRPLGHLRLEVILSPV